MNIQKFVSPNVEIREKIENLRSTMLDLPQLEINMIHCFGGGMYARTGHLKKGTLLIGKIHLKEHINIMSSGEITVLTEEGDKRLQGFNILACKAGTRRVGYVHEDTVWTTILQTDETDQEKIEQMFFAKNHNELENADVC